MKTRTWWLKKEITSRLENLRRSIRTRTMKVTSSGGTLPEELNSNINRSKALRTYLLKHTLIKRSLKLNKLPNRLHFENVQCYSHTAVSHGHLMNWRLCIHIILKIQAELMYQITTKRHLQKCIQFPITTAESI